jgi:sorbitol-specific phosphotransferase system component IIBC
VLFSLTTIQESKIKALIIYKQELQEMKLFIEQIMVLILLQLATICGMILEHTPIQLIDIWLSPKLSTVIKLLIQKLLMCKLLILPPFLGAKATINIIAMDIHIKVKIF